MKFFGKKLFRVLTCVIISILLSVAFFLIALKFNGTPVIMSAFACIAITVLNIVIYLLFDSTTDNKSLLKTATKGIIFMILTLIEILICLFTVLVAFFGNYGFATDNPWNIGLLYIPLAQTGISLFTFLFINEKRQWRWGDGCLVAYPFINIASCAIGYLLMVAVSTLGFVAEFLFLWADVILFVISIIAIIVFIKMTDPPFTYTSNKTSTTNQNTNSGSAATYQSSNTQEYVDTPSRKNGGRDVFFKWLKDYCYHWSSSFAHPNSYYPEFEVKKKLKLYTWSNSIEITIDANIIIYSKPFKNEDEMRMYVNSVKSSIDTLCRDGFSQDPKKIQNTVFSKIDELREKYTGLDEAWSVKVKTNISQEVR